MAGRRGQQQDDPDGAAAAADPPAGPAAGDSSRLDKIEQTQAAQAATLDKHGGLLQQILDKLPGGGQQAGPPAAGAPGPPSPGAPAAQQSADLRSMVADEIAAAEARRADEKWAEEDDKWRGAVDEFMEKIKAEQTPRDPAPGVRGVLQRLTVGKPD